MLQPGFLVGFPHLSFFLFFFSCSKNELFYLSLVLLCFNFFFHYHVLLMKSEVFSTYPNLLNLKSAIFITGTFLLTEIHGSFSGGVGILGSSPDVSNWLNNIASWLFFSCISSFSLLSTVINASGLGSARTGFERITRQKKFSMVEQCCLFNRGNKFTWGADQANLWAKLLSLGSWKNV